MALLRGLLRDDGDLERYLVDLTRPEALTASLNLYRANLVPDPPGPTTRLPPVRAPVLAIWPGRDREERLLASREFVESVRRYQRIETAGHWLPLETPDLLSRLLLKWLA